MLQQVLHTKRMIRQKQIHDGGWYAFGGNKIDGLSTGQHMDAPAVTQTELLHPRSHQAARRSQLTQGFQIDFDVQVSRIAKNRAVLELVEMVAADHVLAASDGNE